MPGKEDLLERTWTRAELNSSEHGPGKFEGETLLTEVLYEAGVAGQADEDVGDVQELGAYWKFDGMELKGIEKPIFAIVSVDNVGFVHAAEYDSHVALEKAWKNVEHAYAPFLMRE